MATYDADIVIIGGGIAGLSLGAALTGKQRVLLLEGEDTLAYHTSGRSASQMQPTYGPEEIRALTTATLGLIPEIEKRIGAPVLSPRPLLWCSLAGASSADVDTLIATVPGLDELTVAEAVRLLPVLREDRLSAVALDAQSKEVDAKALLDYYAAAAAANGVEIKTGARVSGVDRPGDRWELSTGDGIVRAQTVVDAAGGWADSVAGLFGRSPLQLVPYRRTVTVARSGRGGVDPAWPIAMDIRGSFYFRSYGTDILASPMEDVPAPAHDARPHETDVAMVKDIVNGVTDLDLRQSVRDWTGLRTLAPDGLPVVGRDSEDDGFYWLAGQGGYGIQTSAALAQLAAADILGEQGSLGSAAQLAFQRLSPDRLTLQPTAT